MEPKDWISLAGIISTLIVALTTILISHRRELRQEKSRKAEREQEHKQRTEEKRLETQYSKLHEKRAEALSELYNRLTEANIAVSTLPLGLDFITPPGSDEAKTWAEQAHKKCCDCDSFFAKNRLYLSKGLAKQIEDVIYGLRSSAGSIMAHQDANEFDKLKQDLVEWQEKSKVVLNPSCDLEN